MNRFKIIIISTLLLVVFQLAQAEELKLDYKFQKDGDYSIGFPILYLKKISENITDKKYCNVRDLMEG